MNTYRVIARAKTEQAARRMLERPDTVYIGCEVKVLLDGRPDQFAICRRLMGSREWATPEMVDQGFAWVV